MRSPNCYMVILNPYEQVKLLLDEFHVSTDWIISSIHYRLFLPIFFLQEGIPLKASHRIQLSGKER